MPKKKLDNYSCKVQNQKYIPNKENPEKIEITFTFEYGGKTFEITPPPFEPQQVANGSWEKHACRYIDKKIASIEKEPVNNVPDLTGKEIKNSGYDFTGPGKPDDYPEGPDVKK